jgi:hypothetical protein
MAVSELFGGMHETYGSVVFVSAPPGFAGRRSFDSLLDCWLGGWNGIVIVR